MKKLDEELMQRYKEGDLIAFESLYARHREKVYGYLISRLKDVNAADEVFQNVFVKLHRKKGQYDSQYPFIKWLFVITKTQMLDYLKSQKPGEEFFESLHSPINEEESEKIDFSQVKSLTEKERAALSLRYYDDNEFSQIASALETSSTNARKIVSRGLKKLKAAFAGG